MKYLLSIFLIFITIANYAASEDIYSFTNTNDSLRFQALTKEIRCVVCQNQSIADSSAPLANDLREKVYKMVIANQSDAAIKDYLVKRYGEFILLQPRFNKATLVLWFFPVLGLLVAAYIGVRRMPRVKSISNQQNKIV